MTSLFANITYATFSQFVHITPLTEKKYAIEVKVTRIENQENKYKIRVPLLSDDHKHVWLITCKNAIAPEQQDFRNYIWSLQEENRNIVLKTHLMPEESLYAPPDLKKSKYIELILDKNILMRSYIYIDFPPVVSDGGFYYSIDLSTYLEK